MASENSKNSIEVRRSPDKGIEGDVRNWEEKAEEVGAPETSEGITRDELADYFLAEVTKGDGEVDCDVDYDSSIVRGVTLDVDIAKHMSHYHKNGINEKSVCKYLWHREGENNIQKDYYSKILPLSVENAENWLRSNTGAYCYHPKNQEDIRDLFFSENTTDRLVRSKALDDGEYKEVIQCVYRVCFDIKNRFPWMKWGFDFVYGYNTVGAGSGGFSSLDRRIGLF